MSNKVLVDGVWRQPVECYSRVSGYMRPIQQWNDAKVAEFYDRKKFTTTPKEQ
jgi:anaerobic ribonucleoside-triphosphate reductase